MNDLVIKNKVHVPKSVEQLKADIDSVQRALKGVMKAEVHYGMLPGTRKNTLLKPGAEIILSMFRIAVDPVIEDLSTDDHIRYRVTCNGTHMPTGGHIGSGVGEASTQEEKYAWRAALCKEEYDDWPEDKRRIKYKKKYQSNEIERIFQVRMNPADVANTVLKMAKKRAMIDLTLTATAASDAFTQDLEDLPSEYETGPIDHSKANTTKPQSRSGGNGKATDKQLKLIRVKLDQGNVSEQICCEEFSIERLEELPIGAVNDVLSWISGNKQG